MQRTNHSCNRVACMPPLSMMDAGYYAHRKTVSDNVAGQVDKLENDFAEIVRVDEQVTKAKCECCGLDEEYTENYINKIKESHSRSWVCGLCSEAVGEMVKRGAPYVEMKEAVEKHRQICQEFDGTRLNPKLALTYTMRKIARRSSEYKRETKNVSSHPRIARSTSCVSRIN